MWKEICRARTKCKTFFREYSDPSLWYIMLAVHQKILTMLWRRDADLMCDQNDNTFCPHNDGFTLTTHTHH